LFELVKVEGENLETIAKLAHRIWNIHYPPIVGQAQVDYMLERFYNLDSLQKQQAEGHLFYLIESDTTPIGFISISEKEEDNYFIHKFYIDNAIQGKGFGAQTFEKIKQLINTNKSAKTIQLTVNRQNYKAINFYFKIGFKIKEVADFDIDNGYQMNDFIMEWKNPF
jgi:RimJ/RimL family protein N-acetyltransferase